MIYLKKVLDVWGGPEFESILKSEIEKLDATELPLQKNLTQSNYTNGDNFCVLIINTSENQTLFVLKQVYFFQD